MKYLKSYLDKKLCCISYELYNVENRIRVSHRINRKYVTTEQTYGYCYRFLEILYYLEVNELNRTCINFSQNVVMIKIPQKLTIASTYWNIIVTTMYYDRFYNKIYIVVRIDFDSCYPIHRFTRFLERNVLVFNFSFQRSSDRNLMPS